MIRHMLVGLVALAISAGAANAQTTIKKAPIKPTPATDAKKMFDSYCAVCHGNDGTGNGPAAKALTKAPADLTKISARNGGTFPDVRVRRYIEGVDEVAAHGTRDMPMWGPVFKSTEGTAVELRIKNLVDYVASLQAK